MRIGILALLHESNTFSPLRTTIESFQQDLFLTGEPIRDELAWTHHEVGGFFGEIEASGSQAVPLLAARALPSGSLTRDAFTELTEGMLQAVRSAGRLDGILFAAHGATVSEGVADADGHWMARLRYEVGPLMPIVSTIDAHANLSRTMVDHCDAIVGYRTNPHTDQRARGREAAALLVRTIRGEFRPVMAAAFPPLAISIDRQCTDDPHLRPLYAAADRQLTQQGVLSNSIVLGFPYADVAEMGSSVIVVAANDPLLADRAVQELAQQMWRMRREFDGRFTGIDRALEMCDERHVQATCLLDMGDNVGGGSAGDGTSLIAALHRRKLGPSFACLYDPQAVERCRVARVNDQLLLPLGGKVDALHGKPFEIRVRLRSMHDGRFAEDRPRHGGIARFDQGLTAICTTGDDDLTLMLTSRRMVPFSLQQLFHCGLDPRRFRVLVAKGVNAPIAAYREVCDRFIRVNTSGSTCADLRQLNFLNRRRPMFPFEHDAVWRERPS